MRELELKKKVKDDILDDDDDLDDEDDAQVHENSKSKSQHNRKQLKNNQIQRQPTTLSK